MKEQYRYTDSDHGGVVSEPMANVAMQEAPMMYAVQSSPQIPNSYEEAIAMGCEDIETFSKELHGYIDELAVIYNLK